MEARLSEVQKRLVRVVLAALALALVVWPGAENRRYTAAFHEVEAFRNGFMRSAVDASLQQLSQEAGALDLPELLAAVQAQRGPKLKLADGVARPDALASLQLETLGDAERLARAQASVTLRRIDAQGLGGSLAWRLARAQRPGVFTLTKLELTGGEVDDADASQDPDVGSLRSQSLSARVAADDAARRVSNAERRVEKRAKRHSRSLDKAQAQLDSAQLSLQEKTRAHAEAQARYDAAAQRADRPRSVRALSARATTALAHVELTQGKERLRFDIPVRLVAQSAALPGVRGAEFPAVQAAGLWEETRGLTPAAASEAIADRFNWQARTLQVGPVALHGSKLLQLFPCVVPVLLALLLLQMRRTEAFYSPFTTKVPNTLPKVGLKHRALELLGLVVVPLLVSGFAAAGLLLLRQFPLLPLISAFGSGVLGTLAFSKLEDLRNQAISIVRSHSYPPPAADLSPLNWG
ncbi:MAG TPA: hypothetical protein VFZ61_10000 [Polyangiales bacterium]